MAKQLFADFYITQLETAISASDTEMKPVSLPDGIPSITAGDYFYLVLSDDDNNREIVKVTDYNLSDSMDITRAQGDSVARNWPIGTQIAFRVVSTIFQDMQLIPDGTTVQRSSEALSVVDPLANDSVTEDEIISTALGNGLTGGSGTVVSIDPVTTVFEFTGGKLDIKDGGITQAFLDATPSNWDALSLFGAGGIPASAVASSGSGASSVHVALVQASHGFASDEIGEMICYDGTNYVKSTDMSAADQATLKLRPVGLLSAVPDSDNFSVCVSGLLDVSGHSTLSDTLAIGPLYASLNSGDPANWSEIFDITPDVTGSYYQIPIGYAIDTDKILVTLPAGQSLHKVTLAANSGKIITNEKRMEQWGFATGTGIITFGTAFNSAPHVMLSISAPWGNYYEPIVTAVTATTFTWYHSLSTVDAYWRAIGEFA